MHRPETQPVSILRCAHAASEDARNLRRQLDSAQEQIARLTEEKNRLAAQVEAHRLDAIMSSMAPRTGGRIVALAGASAAGGATPGVGAGLSVGLGVGGIPGTARPAGTAGAVGALGGAGLGLAGDGQRTAPTSYSRWVSWPHRTQWCGQGRGNGRGGILVALNTRTGSCWP